MLWWRRVIEIAHVSIRWMKVERNPERGCVYVWVSTCMCERGY